MVKNLHSRKTFYSTTLFSYDASADTRADFPKTERKRKKRLREREKKKKQKKIEKRIKREQPFHFQLELRAFGITVGRRRVRQKRQTSFRKWRTAQPSNEISVHRSFSHLCEHTRVNFLHARKRFRSKRVLSRSSRERPTDRRRSRYRAVINRLNRPPPLFPPLFGFPPRWIFSRCVPFSSLLSFSFLSPHLVRTYVIIL